MAPSFPVRSAPMVSILVASYSPKKKKKSRLKSKNNVLDERVVKEISRLSGQAEGLQRWT